MSSSNSDNVLGTGVDEILRELDDAGKASVSSLASETGFEKEKVKEWGKALEKSGLVKVKYSGIKGMVLVYDSDKDYKQVSEKEDLDLDESDLEDENNDGEGSESEDEKDDLNLKEQVSVAETVHREDLDVESDKEDEDDEDDRQKVDLDGGRAELDVSGSAGGGVKDDVVEGSEVSESNVVEINESEIDEVNLGTSKNGEDEEELDEIEESSEEYLEEDLEMLEEIEEKAEDKNREDEEVVLGDDIEEDVSEEEIVDSEELSEEEVILPNSEETEGNDFTEDVEETLEKIKNLNNSVGDVEEDEDVYNELEVELNILKDLIEDEELSDELNEEVVDCMDEAEANLQKVKDDKGIISRVKSMLGFGKEDEEEDLESFESTEVDMTDEISDKDYGENDLEISNKDLNEDSSRDKFIGKGSSSQEGFSLDEESFDEIENVVNDKSTDSVDYKPGENLEEVLNSIDKITASIAAGKEVDASFNKVSEELNKMKEIIKDRDLDNSEEENVIVTINSLEDALETNKSSLLQRFKSKIGGVFR